MQVTETSSEGLTRGFKVVIPAGTIDTEVNTRLNQLAPTIRMPGFRPGKVPPALLKKRYGGAVMGEVLEKMVNESSQQALQERDLRPATQPRIEVTSFAEGGDLEFTLTVDIMPEIAPMDFSKLEIERLVAEPSEADVDEAIGKLAAQQKNSEPVSSKRKSKAGDVAVINFVGKVDGKPFEGGSGQGHHLELGSGSFIPGFEDQLIGAKAGDQVEVKVTFPADYGHAPLAGKDAVFETEVVELREPVETKIDDEFAKLFGMEDLASLKEAVKGQLTQEFAGAARARMKRTLLDALEKAHDFAVPDGMVAQEYEAICRAVNPQKPNDHDHHHDHDHDHDHHHDHDHDHDHEHHHHDHDHDHHHDHDHAHHHEHAPDEGLSEEDKAEYRAIAERRVRLGLLLQEVGRLNNISVADGEVAQAIYREAAKYPGQEQQVVQFYQQNAQAQASIRAPMLEDKIVDFIVEMAKVSDKKVSAKELFQEDEAEDGEGGETETSTKKSSAKKAPAKKKAASKKEAKAED